MQHKNSLSQTFGISQKIASKKSYPFSIELLTGIYLLITSIFIFIYRQEIPLATTLLYRRAEIASLMLILMLIHIKFRNKLSNCLRIAFQIALLSYWYPETYTLNVTQGNYDHIFATIDQWIFSSQPAIKFFQTFPYWFISEALHFAYFIYFGLIVSVIFVYFFSRYYEVDRTAFIIFGAFFLYYLIFIFLPVAGPQYYFPAIGSEAVEKGYFPVLSSYFSTNNDLIKELDYPKGLFYRLVEISQKIGERPTAAFPSSHVGITTIIILLYYRFKPMVAYFLFPIYILLCMATVYLQAHYFIDVIGGVISALIFYPILSLIYDKTLSH